MVRRAVTRWTPERIVALPFFVATAIVLSPFAPLAVYLIVRKRRREAKRLRELLPRMTVHRLPPPRD